MDDRTYRSDSEPPGRTWSFWQRSRGTLLRQHKGVRKQMRFKRFNANAIIRRPTALMCALLLLTAAVYCLAPPASASDPGTGDWPMWGGTPDRNMVSNQKNMPTSWDVKTKKNIKWVAQLGSQTFGNVVVSGGMVFVGTNNEGLRDPKIRSEEHTSELQSRLHLV